MEFYINFSSVLYELFEVLLIYSRFVFVKQLGLGLGLGLGTGPGPGTGDLDWGLGNGELGMGKWEMESTQVPGDDSIMPGADPFILF